MTFISQLCFPMKLSPTTFFLLTLFFTKASISYAQTTIYVAPAPKSYWDQKREDADNKLKYTMMQNQLLKDQLRGAQAEGAKCADRVRTHYIGMSDYPKISSGVHEVHIIDGDLICLTTKCHVDEVGKVDWTVGKNGIMNTKSSEVVKNAKTKIVMNVEGKTYFIDVFFIYEK